MEVGVYGVTGVNAVCMERLRGREAATILPLYMGLLVREMTSSRRSVVSLSRFHNTILSIIFPYLADGGWSVWSDWTQCSVFGKVQRKRSCNNPSPLHGAPCQGEDNQEEDCGKSHYFQ